MRRSRPPRPRRRRRPRGARSLRARLRPLLLWRNQHSEAWLNTWWEPRDTGYHDHEGSCVGHVIEGTATNEGLPLGARRVRRFGAGDTFWLPARPSTGWTTTPVP